jgi:hypothetical protein
MTRAVLSLTAFGLSAAVAAAGVIPPVPRLPEAALKGLGNMAEQPGEAESPEKIAERIAQNTKAAGDKLAGLDTGEGTQKTQDQILKDIDALLKQAENPPPMGGGGQSKDMNDMSQQGEQKQQGGGQSQGGGKKNPSGGMQPGGGQPKGGAGKQPKGGSWRDRRGQEKGGQDQQPMGQGEQQPGGQQPMPKGMGDPQGPMQPGGVGQQEPKQPGGPNQAGANPQGGMGGRATPALPLDDAITKQVWGHLPERLRQQMTQYYREQFMPRYGELLKQYYSSLAEREKAQKK